MWQRGWVNTTVMEYSILPSRVCCSYPMYIIFTNPSARAGYDTRSIFKRSLTGLNSEFSFSKTSCLTKAEEPSLPYYLPIAGGRIIGFITFPRVLVLSEMQSILSRIWTRVAVSISYDNNHYTTGTWFNKKDKCTSFPKIMSSITRIDNTSTNNEQDTCQDG